MGQHYVSEEAFRRKAAERGFGAVSPDAYPAFCAFVYAVTRAALALVSLVTPSHVKTIQPEDFMTLEKIGSLLVTPVLCGRGKNQRGGGADEGARPFFRRSDDARGGGDLSQISGTREMARVIGQR